MKSNRVVVEQSRLVYVRRGDPIPRDAIRQPSHTSGDGDYFAIGVDRVHLHDGARIISWTWDVKKLEWARAEINIAVEKPIIKKTKRRK